MRLETLLGRPSTNQSSGSPITLIKCKADSWRTSAKLSPIRMQRHILATSSCQSVVKQRARQRSSWPCPSWSRLGRSWHLKARGVTTVEWKPSNLWKCSKTWQRTNRERSKLRRSRLQPSNRQTASKRLKAWWSRDCRPRKSLSQHCLLRKQLTTQTKTYQVIQTILTSSVAKQKAKKTWKRSLRECLRTKMSNRLQTKQRLRKSGKYIRAHPSSSARAQSKKSWRDWLRKFK